MTKMNAKKVYYLYSGLFAMAISMVFSASSLYHINVVHLNALQLVLVGTALEITHFIFEAPTGIIADRFSRKKSIVIGTFLVGIGLFIEGAFPLFVIIMMAQIIWGFGDTFISGADTAWIVDEVGNQEIDIVFVKAAQISQLTALIGVFISMGLALFNPGLPLIFTGLLCIGLSIFILVYMPETNFKPLKSEIENPFRGMLASFFYGIKQITGKSMLIIAAVVIGIEGLYSEGFDRLWTMRIINELPLPKINQSDVFWLLVANSIAAILCIFVMWVLNRRLLKKKNKNLIGILFLLSSGKFLSVIAFALTQNFTLALLLYCSSYALRRSFYPLYDSWVNKCIEDSGARATVISIFGQINSIGQIIGGPLIGLLALKTTTSLGLLVSGLLILPIALIFLQVKRKATDNQRANQASA